MFLIINFYLKYKFLAAQTIFKIIIELIDLHIVIVSDNQCYFFF